MWQWMDYKSNYAYFKFFKMKVQGIYLLLELREPKSYTQITKAMEVHQTIDSTRKMLTNLKHLGLINKGDWYSLTEKGKQTINDHVDKILSKL